MSVWGTNIHDTNVRLRFYIFCFAGIIAFASVLYWRSHLLLSQDYVEFPKHEIPKSKQEKKPLKASEQTDELRKELGNE